MLVQVTASLGTVNATTLRTIQEMIQEEERHIEYRSTCIDNTCILLDYSIFKIMFDSSLCLPERVQLSKNAVVKFVSQMFHRSRQMDRY